MTLIVQLSDTHFGTEVAAVRDAAIRAVNALRADLLILSGDITQRARPEEFRAATDFLDALSPRQRLVIPGNHDLPLLNPVARLLAPYRAYEKAFGPREAIWRGAGVTVIGLDATNRFRHTRGALADEQLRGAVTAARAGAAPGTLLLVCAHQPLHTAWTEDHHDILIDAAEVARSLSTLGVDAVLSGHVHVPLCITTQQPFPQLQRHFVLAGAGTAISRRTRPGAPNSFNAFALEEDAIHVSRHVFDANAGEFKSEPAVSFGRGATGWHALNIAKTQ